MGLQSDRSVVKAEQRQWWNNSSFSLLVVAFAEGGAELLKVALFDRFSRFAHEGEVEIKIVERKQPQSQHFSSLEEMAEVSS